MHRYQLAEEDNKFDSILTPKVGELKCSLRKTHAKLETVKKQEAIYDLTVPENLLLDFVRGKSRRCFSVVETFALESFFPVVPFKFWYSSPERVAPENETNCSFPSMLCTYDIRLSARHALSANFKLLTSSLLKELPTLSVRILERKTNLREVKAKCYV